MHCLYPSTTLDFSASYNTHKQRHYNSRWMLLKQQVVKALSIKNKKKGRGGVGGDERLVSFVFHCSPFHSVSCPLCHSGTRTFISACTEASSHFSAHGAVKCWLWISYVFAKPLMRKMLFLLCSFILPSEGWKLTKVFCHRQIGFSSIVSSQRERHFQSRRACYRAGEGQKGGGWHLLLEKKVAGEVIGKDASGVSGVWCTDHWCKQDKRTILVVFHYNANHMSAGPWRGSARNDAYFVYMQIYIYVCVYIVLLCCS